MAKKKNDDRNLYSLYLRNGIYYARLWDAEAGKYTPAKSTGETNEQKAGQKALEMKESGQLVKREKDPLFIDELVKYWENRNDICRAYKTDILNRIIKKAVPSDHLKNVRMSQIGHVHINRLSHDLKNTDTPSGINNLLKNIKTFIRWADSLGYVQKDFTSRITMIPRKKGKRGFLEPDEMMRVSRTPWHDLRTKAAVMLGMWAGMRYGETRALQWGDIDFNKNTIDIKRNFVDDWDEEGNPIYKAPKAESFRRWPYLVFPELKNTLLELYEETPFNGPDDLVLCNVGQVKEKQYLLKQYKPITYAHMQKTFKKFLSAAGISIEEQKARKLSFHSLRHSFTSFMATNAPAAAVMGLTGHENEKVYEGYRHNIKSASIDALNIANMAMDKFRQEPEKPVLKIDKPDFIN